MSHDLMVTLLYGTNAVLSVIGHIVLLVVAIVIWRRLRPGGAGLLVGAASFGLFLAVFSPLLSAGATFALRSVAPDDFMVTQAVVAAGTALLWLGYTVLLSVAVWGLAKGSA